MGRKIRKEVDGGDGLEAVHGLHGYRGCGNAGYVAGFARVDRISFTDSVFVPPTDRRMQDGLG